MSEDATLKTFPKEVADAIRSARDPSDLQNMLTAMAALHATPQQEPDVPLPANGFKYEKEIRFHPESGKRPLVIRANSLEDLNALEAQILNY